jgi:hypothetical protein
VTHPSSDPVSMWHRFLCWLNGTCRQDFDPDGDEFVCRCGNAYGATSWGDADE